MRRLEVERWRRLIAAAALAAPHLRICALAGFSNGKAGGVIAAFFERDWLSLPFINDNDEGI